MKTLHLDGKAKMSSLKWCEFSMDWDNLQDMPIHHGTEIVESQIQEILDYNRNDVLATKELFDRHRGQVGLRKELTKTFGMDLLSASEPRIAKEIFGKYICEAMGITKKELAVMRTPRDKIIVKDLILPFIEFETKEFNNVLKYFKSLILFPEKDVDEEKIYYSQEFNGAVFEYGLGGIHGFVKEPTIFEESEDVCIMSNDIISMYPHFNFLFGVCPEHLPKEIFNPLYKGFFTQRQTIPKSNPMNYVLKIILNSTWKR